MNNTRKNMTVSASELMVGDVILDSQMPGYAFCVDLLKPYIGLSEREFVCVSDSSYMAELIFGKKQLVEISRAV